MNGLMGQNNGLMAGGIPDEVKRQMLYQALSQMGAGLVQPMNPHVPRNFMGDLTRSVAGGLQGFNENQAAYLQQIQEQEQAKQKQAMEQQRFDLDKALKGRQDTYYEARTEEAQAGMKEKQAKTQSEASKLKSYQDAYAKYQSGDRSPEVMKIIFGLDPKTPAVEKPLTATEQAKAKIWEKIQKGEKLTDRETKLFYGYSAPQGDKPDKTYQTTQARKQAEIDLAEKTMGRPLTQEEKRRMFINDPYGLLAPSGVPPASAEAPKRGNLDEKTAASILKEAGGNKDKAREIARKRGYEF